MSAHSVLGQGQPNNPGEEARKLKEAVGSAAGFFSEVARARTGADVAAALAREGSLQPESSTLTRGK